MYYRGIILIRDVKIFEKTNKKIAFRGKYVNIQNYSATI
jgi:hypothetical protein